MTTEAGKRHVRLLACGAKVPGHVAVCGYDRESPIHDLWPEIGLRDFYVGRESDRHEYVPGEPEDMCEECRREWPCDVLRAEAEARADERTRIAELEGLLLVYRPVYEAIVAQRDNPMIRALLELANR